MKDSLSKPQSWDEQKAKLKARFRILTDADVNYTENKKDQMLSNLQEKLGWTKEELEIIIGGV